MSVIAAIFLLLAATADQIGPFERPPPDVLNAVVRANQNTAGIYAAVTRIGRLAVGQTLFLHAATENQGP